MDLESRLDAAIRRQLAESEENRRAARRARLTSALALWSPAFIAAAAPALHDLLERTAHLAQEMATLGPGHARLAAGLPERALGRAEEELALWLDRLAADYPEADVDWQYAGSQVGIWWASALPAAFERLVRPGPEYPVSIAALLADLAGDSADGLAAAITEREQVTIAAAPCLWAILGNPGPDCPAVWVRPYTARGFVRPLLGEWQPAERRVILAGELFWARYAAAHPPIDAPAAGRAWETVGEPCLALLRSGLISPGHALLHELVHASLPSFPLDGAILGREGEYTVSGLVILGPENSLFVRAPVGASLELHEALVETIAAETLPAARAAVDGDIWESPPAETVPAFRHWGRPDAGYPVAPALVAALLAPSGLSATALAARPDQLEILLAGLPAVFAPADASAFRAWLTGDGPPGYWPAARERQQRYWLERVRRPEKP
jgi:hypothetical protein